MKSQSASETRITACEPCLGYLVNVGRWKVSRCSVLPRLYTGDIRSVSYLLAIRLQTKTNLSEPRYQLGLDLATGRLQCDDGLQGNEEDPGRQGDEYKSGISSNPSSMTK